MKPNDHFFRAYRKKPKTHEAPPTNPNLPMFSTNKKGRVFLAITESGSVLLRAYDIDEAKTQANKIYKEILEIRLALDFEIEQLSHTQIQDVRKSK